jgi:hypothetical protein
MKFVLCAVVLGAYLLASPAGAQEATRPSDAEVHAVLQALEVEHTLVSLSQNTSKALADVAPSLDRARRSRIAAILDDAFLPDRLHQDVTDFVRQRSGEGQVAALSEWLLSEEFRAIRARMNPDAMPESFLAYAEHLQANPASPERFDLVARMVYAQRAGDFFILTTDGLQAAVERLVDLAAGPGSAMRVELTPQQEANRLQDVQITSFIAFMRRLEPLSDAEAQQLLGAYESTSGQWWITTYADAVLAAIDAAAERASAALR